MLIVSDCMVIVYDCKHIVYFLAFIRQTILVAGFNPSEKYESELGLLFPIYGKIKNVPNHQPAC